jgi:gamma-glutamylcyclotransferase
MRYFAYGSNLSKEQMKQRCPDSKPLFPATLPNYKLVITGWDRQWRGGVATILRSRGDKVRGAVYELSDADLRKLDKYESGYARQNVTVFDEDGEAHELFTYVKNGQIEASRPSQSYGDVIRRGYRDWGII